MSRIAGKMQVDRILAYLETRRKTALWEAEQDSYSAAWVLVYVKYYVPKEPAFARALHAYGVDGSSSSTTVNGISMTTQRLCFGLAHPQTEIDGRNGRQWMTSVQTYLTWRSGGAWRRLPTDRFNPEYDYYIRAVNFLNQVNQRLQAQSPVAQLESLVFAGQQFIQERGRLVKQERRRVRRQEQASGPGRKPCLPAHRPGKAAAAAA